MTASLQAGDAAPAFSMPTADGGTISSETLRGKPFVLYFYPKDDTSGCTQEALSFTEMAADFSKRGATVIGVSRDSVASHAKFAQKHGLSVTLAADVDGTVTEAFGVWVEKSMYGKKYMGIERSTFLIDGSGQILRVWRKVKVAGHAAEVLNSL